MVMPMLMITARMPRTRPATANPLNGFPFLERITSTMVTTCQWKLDKWNAAGEHGKNAHDHRSHSQAVGLSLRCFVLVVILVIILVIILVVILIVVLIVVLWLRVVETASCYPMIRAGSDYCYDNRP